MDLLFIIFISVVGLGFVILLCISCYCLCCRPLSYSSSSSYYSESRHGGYKSGTSKLSKTTEYDDHHWNSAFTLPLITPLPPLSPIPPSELCYSTSTISSRQQAQPVGFEHVAKSKSEPNQTINSYSRIYNEGTHHPINVKTTNEELQTYRYPNNQTSTTITTYSEPIITPYPTHPSNSKVTNQTVYYTNKTADPYSYSVSPVYTTRTITTYPVNSTRTIEMQPMNSSRHTATIVSENKQYPKPYYPMDASSPTKTETYVVKSTSIPHNNVNEVYTTKENVYSNQSPHLAYTDSQVVNESQRSGAFLKKHSSTGSLYENM